MKKRFGVMILISALLILIIGMIGVASAYACTDSDNGVSYYAKGQVIVLENETSLSYNDACVYKLEETSAEFYVNLYGELYNNEAECSGDNCYVAEAFCENNAKKWTVKTCLNGCSNGACLCPTTKCSDGVVYGPEKCRVIDNICECPSCPVIPETCKQEGGIISWQDSSSQCCGGLAKITESSAYSSDCSAITTNANSICTNCGNTLCGVGESKCNCPQDCKTETIVSPTFYISGVDGVKDVYAAGEELKLTIKGIEQDGTPASAEEGFNIQFYIDEWPLVSGQGSMGGNANYKEGYWYASINVPEKIAKYRLQVFLYCSRENSICSKLYGIKGAQVEKTFYFSTTQSTCKDSDNGKNIYVQGITTGLDWGSDNKVEKKDYCITEGEKSGRLAEYYCNSASGVYRVASESFECPLGCKDGACVPNSPSACQPGRCEDGTIPKCKIVEGKCVCSTCQQIIVKPVCGNGICESGEGEICACPAIEEKMSYCEEGKECKIPACSCNVACPQDCKPSEGIYANLNEKFKLQVYQPVKIVENEKHLMKITFKDLIAYKCKGAAAGEEIGAIETKKIEEKVAVAEATITGRVVSETAASSAGGGGAGGGQGVAVQTQVPIEILKCIGAGPKALLDVDIIENNELGKHWTVNLDVGEKKQIGEFAVSFLNYDYASRTGVFLVSRETSTCPEKCKCDEKGKVIECWSETCKEGETLCPDGKCREKCEIISEDCKFGCFYEGKCFPMGVRSKGLYCNTDLVMSSQFKEDEACENNFECSSNVCAGGKCISGSLIQKILSWFKRMFGGG